MQLINKKNDFMSTSLYFSKDYQKLSFGDNGLRVISATETSVSGETFGAIQVIEDSTISCDNNTDAGDSSISSLGLTSGTIIYGNFDDISVASGKIIAYLR